MLIFEYFSIYIADYYFLVVNYALNSVNCFFFDGIILCILIIWNIYIIDS